ncbi:hypothetical protein P7K49_000443 [Saguinus oedipus]|uniref:Uncharacterized protein n=1 Tax=Saguinus oedipus TaxID=9490 RepID=A0ABQ9WBP0_SAGOE|nr:hypothetical protein P7K49_000443 [Saguinus oedipus]
MQCLQLGSHFVKWLLLQVVKANRDLFPEHKQLRKARIRKKQHACVKLSAPHGAIRNDYADIAKFADKLNEQKIAQLEEVKQAFLKQIQHEIDLEKS